jgi:hypothetical protein
MHEASARESLDFTSRVSCSAGSPRSLIPMPHGRNVSAPSSSALGEVRTRLMPSLV